MRYFRRTRITHHIPSKNNAAGMSTSSMLSIPRWGLVLANFVDFDTKRHRNDPRLFLGPTGV